MAKTKKNRAGLSEKIAHKNLKSKAAKLNPFDIRFVKSKQNPCRMECRISNLQQGSNEFLLSSVQTCQFSTVYNTECE